MNSYSQDSFQDDRYTYRVTWYPEEDAFLGLCPQFPNVNCLAATQALALAGIRRHVAEVISNMLANDEMPPNPQERRYSGRFQLRISPALYRTLTIRAAEERISFNQLCTTLLTRGTCPYTRDFQTSHGPISWG